MNFLTKVLGFFLIIFSFAFYQASPMQRGHGHGHGYGHGHGPKKYYYQGPYRPYYRPVVYERPRHHYKKRYYYEPVRPRYYSDRPYRVHHSRPVIIVKL